MAAYFGCRAAIGLITCLTTSMLAPAAGHGQSGARAPQKPLLQESDVPYPPELPGGESVITHTSTKFLQATTELRPGVVIAKEAPMVDFLFYPGQNYVGKPWSNWGDSLAANGKYYSAIGDHLSIGAKTDDPGRTGTALVFEYDPRQRTFRELADIAKVLKLPQGHYTPGKIHSRLDLGSDGNLYFATHRGSPKAASDANHYQGDWIFRCDPSTAKTEVVARIPVAKHSCPASVLDPDRLIFYGGTAAGPDAEQQGIWFFAYDCRNNKLLYAGPDGPARYMMFARSTGRVYYVPGNGAGALMRYDPQSDSAPSPVGRVAGIRAASEETADGHIFAVSQGSSSDDAELWAFNAKTEEVESLGLAAVGSQQYIASLDVDAGGRYLYYVAGAHGGSPQDGTPVVQFDLQSKRKKVIAFLHPFYEEKYGFTLKGTYGTAIDPVGDKLYITFNVSRGTRAWDCCGLAVVHIPATER